MQRTSEKELNACIAYCTPNALLFKKMIVIHANHPHTRTAHFHRAAAAVVPPQVIEGYYQHLCRPAPLPAHNASLLQAGPRNRRVAAPSAADHARAVAAGEV
jgi:hypothetical protein